MFIINKHMYYTSQHNYSKFKYLTTDNMNCVLNLKQKQQIIRISLLPLWSGLLSCLLAIQNPVSLEPFYSVPRLLVACCRHSGTHQFPCVESELCKCIRYIYQNNSSDTSRPYSLSGHLPVSNGSTCKPRTTYSSDNV